MAIARKFNHTNRSEPVIQLGLSQLEADYLALKLRDYTFTIQEVTIHSHGYDVDEVSAPVEPILHTTYRTGIYSVLTPITGYHIS